jgi:hypothetical protein
VIRTHEWLACVFALMLFASTSVAHAQPASAGVDYAGAMRQGTDLYEQGNKLGAIQIWEQLVASLGEERAWKVLYNLGLAYQSVGDPTRAIERLDAFVKYSGSAAVAAPTQRDLEERRQDAMDRLRAIRSTHGAVHVVPPPSGAIVLVRAGASEAKPAGFTVYVAPGDHAFEIYSGTANARRVTVHSVAGMTTELAVPNLPATSAPKEEPKPLPSPPTPAPMTTRESFPTVWLAAGAGLTVASGVLPLVFGLRTADKRDEAEAIPTVSPRYPGARSEFEDARSTYHLSYIVPAALAVATAVIVILKLPSSPSASSSSKSAASMRWSGAVEF